MSTTPYPSWRFAPFLLCLLSALAAPAGAQTARSGWSPDQDTPGLGVGGRVFSMTTWANELVVGTYKSPSVDGIDAPHIARYDGLRWRTFGAGFDQPVRSLLDFHGVLVAGGEFRWSGTTNIEHIAYWDGAVWRPLAAGLDGIVWDLCEHQGELYAAGVFTSSGGVPVGHVARFDGVSWHPVGTGTYSTLGDPAVYALASDGAQLFAGGEFTAMNGVPASHVARWDGSTWQGVGGGLNSFGYGVVRDLLLHGGRLYAAGAFGVAGGVSVRDVAAWDGTTWARLGPDLTNQVYGSDARSLCVFNGDVFVGGSFDLVGGAPARRIVRHDGTTLLACGGPVHAEVNPASVLAMVAWGGRLWCAGEFQAIVQPGAPEFPATACFHVASFDGALWERLGTGDFGLDAEAKVIGTWQGKRVIGGRMSYAGAANATGLAVFDGGQWQRLGTFSGTVWDVLDHLGDLWVAGDFTQVNGITVNGVARWDGQQWHALANGPSPYGALAMAVYQGQVHVGTIGNPRRWTGTTWQPFATSIFGAITEMHVHNGLLYLGGSTPFMSGGKNLFQWDGANLAVVGGGTDAAVDALGSYGGDLVVGGRFTQAGGQPMLHVARWNGSTFLPLGVGLPGSTVADFTILQGDLVAAGDLHAPQGGDYVARFDGAQWRGFDGGGTDGFVSSVLADSARGELFVAGWFHHAGGIPSPNFAVWHERLPWWNLGNGTPSPRRPPRLEALSTFVAGEPMQLHVSSAEENTLAILGFGTARIDVPALGVTIVPNLDLGLFAGIADHLGRTPFDSTWPALPSGFLVYAQAFCLDLSMPELFSATNAIALQQP